MDARQIDTRLEAVESLNADVTVRDQFILNLTKLPDLDRMMSRTHAGTCEVQDSVRVLNGFGQIDYTMSLVRVFQSCLDGTWRQVLGGCYTNRDEFLPI